MWIARDVDAHPDVDRMDAVTASQRRAGFPRLLHLAGALVAVAGLASCAHSPAPPTTAAATVRGRLIAGGGLPIDRSGATKVCGEDALIAFYTRASQGQPVGTPVLTTRARAKDGGRFIAHIPPGTYFIAAEDDASRVIMMVKRTIGPAGRAHLLLESISP